MLAREGCSGEAGLRRRAPSRQGGAGAHHLDAQTGEQLQVARDGAIAEQDDAPGGRKRPRWRLPGQRLLLAALQARNTLSCLGLPLGRPAANESASRLETGPLAERVFDLVAYARGQDIRGHGAATADHCKFERAPAIAGAL